MKANRAKTGAILLNYVTGSYYMVTEEIPDGAFAKVIVNGFEQQFLPNDTVVDVSLGEASVKITEANAICFRCVLDAPPVAAEGYYSDDGILMKNGNAVAEQGELYIRTVIPAKPGYLILIVNSKEEGMVDVLTYNIDRDVFHPVYRKMREDYQFYETEAAYFFVGPITAKEEKQEEGVSILSLEERGVVLYIDKETLERRSMPTLCVFDFSKTKVFAETIFLEVEKQRRQNKDGSMSNILDETDEPYMAAFSFRRGFLVQVQDAISCAKTITACIPYKGLFLKSEEGCQLLNPDGSCRNVRILNRKAIAQTAGYDYLVDINSKDGYLKLTLANEATETLCIESKSTRDRGNVVKVYPLSH